MFKLESYIAPILLSYVDKYIKNFRLEDSQVSLWGGDASFHNLDLRLEVLEQELQSPFSFISGHIRELLIHVPWTKLTSEPITITINTIECVLKLKDANSGVPSDTSPSRDKHRKNAGSRHDVEAPPNYVQLLINKIVSNIRIFCNNLILKYVEEDIVLSMNVKHLKVESCNEKWEAAYTEISPTQVVMRKVIGVNDLTVCLDKRNASGKIDFYQEPMLYRCSMTMHLLRTYSSTSNKSSLTRLDVYCNNMEFSMTEQQVPMFLRLLVLLSALQQKQLKSSNDSQENSSSTQENKDNGNSSETWTGWAWSYVSSVLPTQWDENLENQQFLDQSGHIIQIGFYVDNASLTFKVSETSHDKGYYTQKKIRYYPLLTLQLQGIYSELISVGRKWSNVGFGISEIMLLPTGPCSCAHPESAEGLYPYLAIGSKSSNHKTHSLFDASAAENHGQYRTYNTSWDFHMFTNTEAVLLERSPALACDYLYQMEIPEDSSSDILSDLGSNLEYSNLAERASVRVYIGPLKFRLCSGFFHRSGSLQVAASMYDYPPYYVPKAEPHLQELLPPSEEDFDALNEFIPTRNVKVMLFNPVIELQFMDHPFFEPAKGCLFKKTKKHSTQPTIQLHKLPKVTIECKLIEICLYNPMYINRLIHTTCQLPEPPEKMFEACFSKFDINLVGLCSRLVLKQNNSTTLIVPFNLSYQSKSILSPQYWINPDVMHSEINFQSESLTFNCTKAKLIVVSHLVNNIFKKDTTGLKNLKYTSLLYDASKDYAMPYLELSVEGLRFKKVCTNSTVSIDLALESIKAFIFESNEDLSSVSDIQQVLFLSGPEPKTPKKGVSDLPLFIATVQYPIKPESQTHPSFVIFNLQEINVCVDPLVCKWLLYHPIKIGAHRTEERIFLKSLSYTEVYANTAETSRRNNTQIESVHSSSDRDIFYTPQQRLPIIEEEEQVDLQEKIYEFLKIWHPVWKSMLLSGHISQCIIYFPMASISAVGSQGVEEAIKEALNKRLVPNVMVITLPFANIHSAQKQNVVKYLKKLPVKLPESVWNADRPSFPWTMLISDLNCYSMENGKEVAFLKTVRISATIGLSTKPVITDGKTPEFPNPVEASLGSLGVYVHIDVTPIIISVSEAQMYLLASLIYGLTEFFNSLIPKKSIDGLKPEIHSVVTVASPSLSPKDNTLESSGTIPGPDSSDTNENVKLTAWIQWTITKFSIELLSHETNNSQVKLIIDIEDIVSSLDYQNVYLKMKSKIGSISIQHYRRNSEKNKWSRGPFSGVVVRLREDISAEKRPEESGFIGITITRASSQHTHNLWGTIQKKDKRQSNSRYITEIVVSVQPIDVVLSIKTLLGFYSIVAPFFEGFDESEVTLTVTKTKPSFTNQALPLAYLECHDIRLFLPSIELFDANHDVFVIQVEKISLSPTVPNPICRTPIRPDIYRQAAQARILTIPGSELEDRQYQLDVTGLSVSSAHWKDLDQVLNMKGNILRGINENPALEWNNLKQGKLSIVPMLNLKQVIEKFDISVVAAPTMIYKNEIVCSSSFEINFVTDIGIFLSLDHLKLVSALNNEFTFPVNSDLVKEKMQITYPYTRFDIFKDDLETELTEFYKDSGIETSEIRSVLSSKSPVQPIKEKHKISVPSQPYYETPSEVLFTAGKISCCLYQFCVTQSIQGNHRTKKTRYIDEEDRNYEASEEESVDEAIRSHKKYLPLIFFFVSQPNVFSSKQQFANNIHLSCFDIGIKLSDPKSTPISSIPTISDFPIDLIVTRSGFPDNSTGIPPAFFTLKYTKEQGKPANFYIDIARPTKFAYSVAKITSLLTLKNKIFENLKIPETSKVVTEPVCWFRRFRESFKGIEMVQLKTDQLVFVVETENNLDATLTINKSKNRLFLTERPEKIQSFTTFECMTLTVLSNGAKRLLLNPWTVTFEFSALVESWQRNDSEPQIHISIDSDCLMIDLSPEQIKCLEKIVKELSEFSSHFTSQQEVPVKVTILEKDQHYKDDLRAGAFQFIEASSANSDELPLPYQVMFWNSKDTNAMAWRYPQPRALTKVRIFPVPMEIAIGSEPIKVDCNLQYWSEYHCCYISYAQFSLSESEVCYLDLPKTEPQRAVAYIWRVILTTLDSKGKKINRSVISPQALAACMRIDSYFNKSIVPNFTSVVYISKLELSLVNNFNKEASVVLPTCLRQFSPDGALPDTHCFFKVTSSNLRSHLASWDSKMFFLDLNSLIKCSAIDYTFLTEQTLIEQFSFKLEMNLARKLTFGIVSNPFRVIFGPTLAHTLTVNSQLWVQNAQQPEFVIFTRYVICNDTNINLRFGQVNTDEDILLPSRSFHLYCWRSMKYKRKLKVAFEERGWLWSKPFRIDEQGTQFISLNLENNLSVIVTVKSLSTTQKQVTIGGQFVIANMLLEHFEFKIIPETKDDKEMKRAPVHVLGGKTITPSMFVDHRLNYFFRLRFFGLDAAWTGDIPLKEHTKGAQPWLVKVPLQERGQFLSIWCRIIVQDCQKGKRILAMLWPLFMVKSNLPITSNIHIETPTLNVHLDSSVKGKGELQQLYCPGTIDHSHQLTFKLHDGTSISDPYIPLNYSLVDQQKFFKKAEKENVDEILDSLRNCDLTKWPYFGEDLENIDWTIDDQPQTTIQVRYQNACQYSSALSVELLPWCLMVNTFGCPVSLLMNGIELCKIPQYGIVAPPNLDDNFHLGIDTGSGYIYSPPLQLANSDWSQTFYMPKISGTLPPEGGIKTAIKSSREVAMVSLTSIISDQIRLVKISSTHVFSNYLLNQIQVVCFAVPDCDKIYKMPANCEKLSFSVAPQLDKTNSGISIIRWFLLDLENTDSNINYSFYISFCFQNKFGWSCPIRVDDNISRKSFAVKSGKKSVPLVLTSQERQGQIFLSLFHDNCPQTLIENKSLVTLFCGQAVGEGGAAVPESKNFKWVSRLECGACTYYTMPFVSEKFPELPQTCFSEKIVFAVDPKDKNEFFEWSSAVSIINDSEQFVKIPNFGDVKLVVKVTSYTTLLLIESVSEVEINAIDIRGRLSRHEMETVLGKNENRTKDNIIFDHFQSSKILPKSSLYQSLFKPTLSMQNDWESIEIFAFIKSFTVVFLADHNNDLEKEGVASFNFDDLGIEVRQSDDLKISVSILDMQFDNEQYSKESYDFPVVVVSQDQKPKSITNILEKSAKELIRNIKEDTLIILDLVLETWFDELRKKNFTGVKEVKVKLNSISIYVEDLYINKLVEYFTNLFPMRLQYAGKTDLKITSKNVSVRVPELVFWNSSVIAKPLCLKMITVEPLSLLLSVHCSLKMYIALDQSPLQFGRFERRRLLTTPYRLGHAMTMHYLSGAIFGAGWVVSSLELLGSPSGLARAMGIGLRDFINLPYRGLIQGPWAFLAGVTHGSASLMKHVTAGTLQSVTKLASSVARNLDRLTLDEEHLRRTEEQRRQKPQGVTQGFMLGLTGLGISLLGAVGGIAHHPLQSIMADGASPRSLAAGVGLGLVGVLTKPLSGAAELVALTGQGLLQGAGWNPLPQPRNDLQNLTLLDSNSILKYEWKLLNSITYRNVLLAIDATICTDSELKGIALILTTDALIIVNLDDDSVKRIISLGQIQVVVNDHDPTCLSFKIMKQKCEEECIIEMDSASRARVADYVRSTASLLQLPGEINQHSVISSHLDDINEEIICYVNPQNRNYFVCLLALAKQMNNNYSFPVL